MSLERACQAILKQKKFEQKSSFLKFTKAIKIIDVKLYLEGAEIIMPYTPGINGADYPLYGNTTVVNTLSKSLNELIDFEMLESVDTKVHRKIFIDKLVEIRNKDEAKNFLSQLQKLIEWISDNDEIINFPVGICHGDLTLSNIICKDRYLYLIDFLPTFLESPLQDVVKLDQDFIYGWSLRKSTEEVRAKGYIFYEHAYPKNLNKIKSNYFYQYQILMALCIARIIPYIKDDITKNWILFSINKVLRDIK